MRLEERGRPTSPSGSRPTGPATRRSSGARSRRGSPRGELLAVVATDALELGIDIGELDAAICVTFPGTVASLRADVGARRPPHATASRSTWPARTPSTSSSAAIRTSSSSARSRRRSSTTPTSGSSPRTCSPPPSRRRSAERTQPGATTTDPRRALARARRRRWSAPGELRRGRDGRYPPRGPGFPAGAISLRSASPDSVTVVDADSGEMLGTVEAERAFSTVHPGAIYLHMGRSYEVAELDVDARRAIVDAFDGDWYTQPKKETEVYIEARSAAAPRSARGGRAPLRRGLGDRAGDRPSSARASPTTRRSTSSPLDLPEQNFPTQALWYVLADELAGPGGARRPRSCSARCTPPSTPRSPSCRCSRCATAGTSAASRPTSTSRPACRRSSSTTAIPAGSGSPAAASTSSSASSATPRGSSASARARRAALLRAEPEVRQPQRAPPQGRRDRADGGDDQRDRRRGASVEAPQGGVTRPLQISVIGAGAEDPELAALAEEVGRLVAEAGAAARLRRAAAGVMEAASRERPLPAAR